MVTIDRGEKDLPRGIRQFIDEGYLDLAQTLGFQLQKIWTHSYGLYQFEDIPTSWLRPESVTKEKWSKLFSMLSDKDFTDTVDSAIRLSERWLKMDPELAKRFLYEVDVKYFNANPEFGMSNSIPEFVQSTREHVIAALASLRKMQRHRDIGKIPNVDDAIDAVEGMLATVREIGNTVSGARIRINAIASGRAYLPPEELID